VESIAWIRDDIPPIVSFDKHACDVTPPVASHPSQALLEISGTILECCLDFCSFVVLHGDFPAMVEHPTGDKIVVVSVQLKSAPGLVGEAKGEFFILQDTGPISDGPSREAWKSSVDVQARRAVKVPAFQVQRSKKAPDTGVLWSHEPL